MGERILVGGLPGTGKTYGWLTIARMMEEAGKDCTFHVIDPDDGVERVWLYEFPDVKNIKLYVTPQWYGELTDIGYGKMGGVANAFREIKGMLKEGDWVIVEMLGSIWNLAQTGYITEIFGKEIDSYFLEVRRKADEGAKRLDVLEGWTDWSVVNKMHNDSFMNVLCTNPYINVYMTTSMSDVGSRDVEESDIKLFYGDSKARFDGQKHNPHRVKTAMVFSMDKDGWRMSTFRKDRGREFVKNEPLYDFAVQYLQGVAGWK